MKRNIMIGIVVALLLTLVAITLIACAPAEEAVVAEDATEVKGVYQNLDPDREYYLVSSHQAHPYFLDSHIGLRYAAEYFNVKITALGPDAWDTAFQATYRRKHT